MSSSSLISTTSPSIISGRISSDERPAISKIPSDAFSLAIGGFYNNPWTASEVCKSWKAGRPGAFYELVKVYERQDPRISHIISTIMPKDGSVPRWETVFMDTRQTIIDQAQVHGIDVQGLLQGSLSRLLDQIELTKDDHLVRCFDRILGIPTVILPDQILEGTITSKAAAIRTWMAENQEILATIRVLDCSNINLYILPPEIAYLTNLELLDLENNQLTSLPATFDQLHNLQKLYLGNNRLTFLPETFGQLHNLQELFLEDNRLTFLPETFGQLHNLQKLSLADNRLTFLPETFGQLHNLQKLSLADNRLTSLPATFNQLHNLRYLVLINNQLTSLTGTLSQLTNLRGFDIGIYDFISLPFRGYEPYGLGLGQLRALPSMLDLQHVGSDLQQWASRGVQRVLSPLFSAISNRLFPSFNNLEF